MLTFEVLEIRERKINRHLIQALSPQEASQTITSQFPDCFLLRVREILPQ